MITLIHGDNQEAARVEYNRIRSGLTGYEIRTLDGKKLDENSLIQSVQSGSMFSDKFAVFIDNLFTPLGKKIKLTKQYTDIIKQAGAEIEIVLYENKEMGKTVVGGLGNKLTNKLFKHPVVIFSFLDNLRPGNTRELLNTYEKLKNMSAPELVWAMTVKRIRQLLMISDHATPEGLAPWQIGRLTSQAKYFSIDQLTDLYRNLINTEYQIKSGLSPFNTDKQLEMFIINLT